SMASDDAIQTLCFTSYATDGSLTRSYGPAGVLKTVRPGMKPCVHVLPPFFEVAQPMSDEPPLKNRPTCDTATIVEPRPNVSGSTWFLCWLVGFVNGSELSCVTPTFAATTAAMTSEIPADTASVSRRRGQERTRISSPLLMST